MLYIWIITYCEKKGLPNVASTRKTSTYVTIFTLLIALSGTHYSIPSVLACLLFVVLNVTRSMLPHCLEGSQTKIGFMYVPVHKM